MLIKSTFNNLQVDYLQIWFLPSNVDVVIRFVYLSPLRSITAASVYSHSLHAIMINLNTCLEFYDF